MKGRENVEEKGRRYLLEARLRVLAASLDAVTAVCRGNGELYELGFDRGRGWWCSCPAVRRCCHRIALALVWVAPGSSSATALGPLGAP